MSATTHAWGRSAPSAPGAAAGLRNDSPQGPVVKLCGLTRVEDVLAARAVGAWALGFIFAPSPRRLTPAEARRLLDQAQKEIAAGRAGVGGATPGQTALRPAGEGRGPLTVGVFVDAGPEEIAAVIRYVGLDAVQLHGPTAPPAGAVREALGRLGAAVPVGDAGGNGAEGADPPALTGRAPDHQGSRCGRGRA